jgi:hypothetical protein
MTDQQHETDRHRTDEPGGATAYQASLRPPGASVDTSTTEDVPADLAPDDVQNLGDLEDDGTPLTNRSGYDPDAVSGDTGAYRPQ